MNGDNRSSRWRWSMIVLCSVIFWVVLCYATPRIVLNFEEQRHGGWFDFDRTGFKELEELLIASCTGTECQTIPRGNQIKYSKDASFSVDISNDSASSRSVTDHLMSLTFDDSQKELVLDWCNNRRILRATAIPNDGTDTDISVLILNVESCWWTNSAQVITDEEAVATWFLSAISNETVSPDADVSNSELSISKNESERLLPAITNLIKFRLAGQINNDKSVSPVPSSLSSRFRWHMWFFGSSTFGAIVQWLIYLTFSFGIVLSFFRCRSHWINGYGILPGQSSVLIADKKLAEFISSVLPSLGFIGTIEGLGSAFGAVGIISKSDLTKKMSLMEVLINLSTAFSTTFWALCAVVIISFVFTFNEISDEKLEDS